MVETRRLSELSGELQARCEFPDGDLIVALSGGADSAALAFLAKAAGRELTTVHVDHGLRASPALREAAARIAEGLDVTLQTVTVEVPEGASIEAQARAVRYRELLSLAGPGTALLTGHTLDDQAETVLLNLLRGAGLRGMAGIPRWRPPNVHRPLLDVTRSETRELAALAGLAFFDDPMNSDPGLRRNSVRLELMPRLRRYNPRLSAALARLANAARVDSAHLEARVEDIPVVLGEHQARVAIGELRTRSEALAQRALAGIASALRADPHLTAEEVARIMTVVTGERSAAEISGGLRISRSGPMLTFERDRTAPSPQGEVRLEPGVHRVGDVRIEVDRVDEVCRVAPIGTWSAIFPSSARLTAGLDESDNPVVFAGGEPALTIGVRRHPVAFYEPGATGYLSVVVSEESEAWT